MVKSCTLFLEQDILQISSWAVKYRSSSEGNQEIRQEVIIVFICCLLKNFDDQGLMREFC